MENIQMTTERQSAGRFRYTKNPEALTKFLKTMLWVSLGVTVLTIISDFLQLNLLSGYFTKSGAESNDARQSIIGLIYLVIFIITSVVFLKWVHRANLNCRGFGAQGMKYTPGWSVGYYFIPILNLFRPYQVMKEIWKASKNPVAWQVQEGSALLGWWWALWLISGVLGQLSFRMSLNAQTVDSLKAATVVSIISGIVDIPLCIVAVLLVSGIFTMQEKLEKNSV